MQILSNLLVIYLRFSLICLVSSRQNPGMYFSAAFYDYIHNKYVSLYETCHVVGMVNFKKKYIRLLSLSHRVSVNATQNKVTFKALENATNYAFSARLRGYVFHSISHAVDSNYQINQSWKQYWKPYNEFTSSLYSSGLLVPLPNTPVLGKRHWAIHSHLHKSTYVTLFIIRSQICLSSVAEMSWSNPRIQT